MKNKFKTISLLILTILFISISGNIISAYEAPAYVLSPESMLINSDDQVEIEDLSSEILDMANSFETDGFNAELSDIAFDEAYLVYVDASVLQDQPLNPQELSNLLASAKIVWNVPVHSNDKTVVVQVSKAPDLNEIDQTQLTEDEISEATEKAGNWQAVSSTLYDPGSDALNLPGLIKDAATEHQYEAVLVGGEPGTQSVIAILKDSSSVLGAVSSQEYIKFEADSVSYVPYIIICAVAAVIVITIILIFKKKRKSNI